MAALLKRIYPHVEVVFENTACVYCVHAVRGYTVPSCLIAPKDIELHGIIFYVDCYSKVISIDLQYVAVKPHVPVCIVFDTYYNNLMYLSEMTLTRMCFQFGTDASLLEQQTMNQSRLKERIKIAFKFFFIFFFNTHKFP